MSVEILVLSGFRQGERLTLDGDLIALGDDPLCDVRFKPEQDPGARGRKLVLAFSEAGWSIRNCGDAHCFVNQSEFPADSARRLVSGDIVRLSEVGPDFSVSFLATNLIRVTCSCGECLNAHREFAGSSTLCPACGAAVTFPALDIDQPGGIAYSPTTRLSQGLAGPVQQRAAEPEEIDAAPTTDSEASEKTSTHGESSSATVPPLEVHQPEGVAHSPPTRPTREFVEAVPPPSTEAALRQLVSEFGEGEGISAADAETLEETSPRERTAPWFWPLIVATAATCIAVAILRSLAAGTADVGRRPISGKIHGAEGRRGLISFTPVGSPPRPAATTAVVDGSYKFDSANGPFSGLHRALIRLEQGQAGPQPEKKRRSLKKKIVPPGKEGPGSFQLSGFEEHTVQVTVPLKPPWRLDIRPP